jgi:hypothetical protein
MNTNQGTVTVLLLLVLVAPCAALLASHSAEPGYYRLDLGIYVSGRTLLPREYMRYSMQNLRVLGGALLSLLAGPGVNPLLGQQPHGWRIQADISVGAFLPARRSGNHRCHRCQIPAIGHAGSRDRAAPAGRRPCAPHFHAAEPVERRRLSCHLGLSAELCRTLERRPWPLLGSRARCGGSTDHRTSRPYLRIRGRTPAVPRRDL